MADRGALMGLLDTIDEYATEVLAARADHEADAGEPDDSNEALLARRALDLTMFLRSRMEGYDPPIFAVMTPMPMDVYAQVMLAIAKLYPDIPARLAGVPLFESEHGQILLVCPPDRYRRGGGE